MTHAEMIDKLRDVGERTLSNVGFYVSGEHAVAFGALLVNAANALSETIQAWQTATGCATVEEAREDAAKHDALVARHNAIMEIAHARWPNVVTMEQAWDTLAGDRNAAELRCGEALRQRDASRAYAERVMKWAVIPDYTNPTYRKTEDANDLGWECRICGAKCGHDDEVPHNKGCPLRDAPQMKCSACQDTGDFYYGTGHTGPRDKGCPECGRKPPAMDRSEPK